MSQLDVYGGLMLIMFEDWGKSTTAHNKKKKNYGGNHFFPPNINHFLIWEIYGQWILLLLEIDSEATLSFVSNHDCTNMSLSAALYFKQNKTTQHADCVGRDVKRGRRLTGKGECWGEEDVDPGTVDVKHDAKVNGYTAHNSKTVDKGPVGGVQRDLSHER